MKLSARSMTRLTLVALLSFALAVPAAAGAQPAGSVSAAGPISDEEIPGVPLTASPVVGTLDVTVDKTAVSFDSDDVYSIPLNAGETFSARLTGPVGTIDWLAFFGPDATTVYDDLTAPLAESYDEDYPQFLASATDGSLSFTATNTATYYLDVYSVLGAGQYTLEWAKGVKPTVTLTKSHSINYGQSTVLTGSVLATSGAGLVGQRVELFAQAYPYTGAIAHIGTGYTTLGGAYSFSVKPTRYTAYQVISSVNAPGYAFGDSAVRTVGVKPLVTKPNKSTTIYKSRYFKIWGYIKPRHTKGAHTVYVQAWYKKPGATKYKYIKSIKTTNYVTTKYPSYTKYYTKTATLPYRGYWKLIAKAKNDGIHATAYSKPVYVKVK